MFTIEQIKTAHSKVKSGADFPAYIKEIKTELIAHQQGKTDFLTFIKMCATCGIEKWTIIMDEMTCTYYDKAGSIILQEVIPQV